MLLRRSVETFSFRDFSNTRDIRRYCFKYLQVYILIYLYQNQKRKKWNYAQRSLNYIKCQKDFNGLNWNILKALLCKNQFSFFFLIF